MALGSIGVLSLAGGVAVLSYTQWSYCEDLRDAARDPGQRRPELPRATRNPLILLKAMQLLEEVLGEEDLLGEGLEVDSLSQEPPLLV